MASDDRRRRNALSCEGCRQRKVKCDKPSSGDCSRCRRLGKECQLGGSTARPYYHTSKERYELLVSVVRHFVPSTSFSTEGLREVVANLPAPATDMSLPPVPNASTGGAGSALPGAMAETTTPSAPPTPQTLPSCEVNDLEDTLMADAMNIPRLNGSSSVTALNAKIVCHLSQNNGGLHPFQQGESPASFDGRVIPNRNAENLPDRQALEQAAMAFFAEINSVIYVLDQEIFHVWLNDVYSGREMPASVLTIVYLVMALCGDRNLSFSIARSYMDDVIEESSLDSVRAIILMTLYRQRQDERSVSWVMLGAAVRIAQSLGLHQSIGYVQDTSIYRSETKRRLWWSLCELDHWSSCMLGRPPSTCQISGGVSFPSQELNTTPFTPPGYATASATLGCLLGQILEQLYINKENARCKDQLISELLQKIEQWRHDLPEHLCPGSTITPSFARATFYLDLKYNYVCMLLARPYMAHSVLCSRSHDPVFGSRVGICERANRDSADVLQKLYHQGLLTTSLWFDTYFILTTAIILYLRAVKTSAMQEDLQSFLPILKLCNESQVGKYAIENFEKFFRSLESTAAENHAVNMANLPFQSPAGMSTFHGIDPNALMDTNEIPTECFDLEREFGLHFCGADRRLG